MLGVSAVVVAGCLGVSAVFLGVLGGSVVSAWFAERVCLVN